MTQRDKLVSELLMTGLIQFYDDYRIIARNLQCGFSREYILEMSELLRWPAACDWLKERL